MAEDKQQVIHMLHIESPAMLKAQRETHPSTGLLPRPGGVPAHGDKERTRKEV